MIQGIVYSEFDNDAGPRIVFQVPENALCNDVFDSISGYLIIDKPLCGKIVTVSVQSASVIGYPVCIEDDKYHRNALLFNIGFLVAKNANTSILCPLLKKLGSLLETLEKETGFLHKSNTKSLLSKMLTHIFSDLTQQQQCFLSFNRANVFYFRPFPQDFKEPPEINDYDVPLPLCNLRNIMETCAEWDFTLQQLISHIDGIKFLKRISLDANMEIHFVKKCISQFIAFELVQLIDIFLFSNRYATTSRIQYLAYDTQLQNYGVQYVIKNKTIAITKLFALYCSIQPNFRISDFCRMYSESLINIDIRRFIAFGVLHKFIRRVHQFPILEHLTDNKTFYNSPIHSQTNQKSHCPGGMTYGNNGAKSNSPSIRPFYNKRNTAAMAAAANLKAKEQLDEIMERMDGNHCSDDICTEFLIPFSELEAMYCKFKKCCVRVVYK